MKLKPTVNRKIEVGIIGKTPAIRLDMTAFFEKQTDGFPPRRNIFHSAIGNMIIYQPPNFVLNTKMDRYG